MGSFDSSQILHPVESASDARGLSGLMHFALHAAGFAICYGLAFLLRTHFYPSPEVQRWIWMTLPIVVAIKSLVFPLAGASLFASGEQSAADLRRIAVASAIASVLVYVANRTVFASFLHAIPRTVVVVDGVLTAGLFGLPRLWQWLSAATLAIDAEPLAAHPTRPERWFAGAMIFAAIALGILFPVRMGFELSRVGENTLGYDFIYYIEHFDKMFSGNYNWLDLPFDSFVTGGSHCLIIPRLLRVPIIVYTDWNQNYEIALGVLFAAVKVLLLVSLLGRGWNLFGKAWLFAIVSGLTFTLGHFESFQFGPAAMNQQLADAFFLAGCWFLVRQPRGWTAGMLLCGLCSSFSYGSGLFGWPTYLVGMLLLGVRGWRTYLGWFLTAGLSASPYVLYRVLDVGLKREMSHNLFPFHLWVQSLTLPFFTMAEMTKTIRLWTMTGFAGLVFGAVFVTFAYVRYWKTERKELAPATMVLVFPLWTFWLISYGGDQIAAWYSVHDAFVWMGFLGFAFLLGRSARYGRLAPSCFYRPKGFEWMSLAAVMLTAGLLAPGNRTADGKDVFLTSRAPVAMSALREFRTAPTGYAFYPYRIWRVNHPFYIKYAALLEKHGWSVFGRNRLYLLQGDFGLDNVALQEDPQASPTIWIEDQSPEAVDFTTYRRLNLRLAAPNAITWDVAVPAETTKAVFHTAVAMVRKSDRLATCRVSIAAGPNPPEVVWTSGDENRSSGWQTCEVSLEQYASQTVRLTLSCEGETNQTAVWRAPQIQMHLKKAPPPSAAAIAPSNTLAENHPAFSDRDHVLEMSHDLWWFPEEHVKRSGTDPLGWSVTSGVSWIDYHKPFEIWARDYSHFYVKCALTRPDRDFHNISVTFHCDIDGEDHIKETILPLLPTEELRGYWIDLRKLEIYPNTKLTKVTFAAGTADPEHVMREFRLAEARFLRKPAAKGRE